MSHSIPTFVSFGLDLMASCHSKKNIGKSDQALAPNITSGVRHASNDHKRYHKYPAPIDHPTEKLANSFNHFSIISLRISRSLLAFDNFQ